MGFIIRCIRCGEQNQLDDDEMTSVQVYFHKGTPNTIDRMVIYCENCGNKHTMGISWQMDLNTHNQSVQSAKP